MEIKIEVKEFVTKNNKDKTLRYVEYKPDERTKKLPLLFQIHGAGNIGDFDSLKNKEVASLGALKHGKNIPAIVLLPYCGNGTWFDVFETLLEFVDTMSKRDDVDINRIYCIGASMGGYTTWQLGMSRPDLFAGIVPICGGGMYWNAEKLKNIPIWAFHGARDRTVLPEETIKMVRAVNDHGGNAMLTIYPHAEHDSWTPTFNDDKMWEWLFSQSK